MKLIVAVDEIKLRQHYKALKDKFEDMTIESNNRYSLLKSTVIRRFLHYGEDDINHGQYERAVYVYHYLSGLINDLENTDTKECDIDGYKTHRTKLDGFSMLNPDGHPVFYCGYGHFEQVKRDVSEMNKLGCNSIQIEIGPESVLFPIGTHNSWGMDTDEFFDGGETYIYTDGEFEINLSAVKKEIIPVLEKAEKENVAVCLLLSPHYAPAWFLQKYPEIKSRNVGFLKYNIYHPKARKMIEAHLRAVVPLVKDYPALQSICISNEPAFNTALDAEGEDVQSHDLLPTEEREFYERCSTKSQWHEHLKSEFKTISELNDKWNTKYTAFSEIHMPMEDDGTPCFYEWYTWNNKMFALWHKWMANIVREIAPDIPIHAKFMPVFGTSELPYHRRFLKYGIDPELFAEFTDISGNDAWSFEGKSHLPLSYKLAWYDLLASIKKMPIQNSEDHVIEDRDSFYGKIQAKRIYGDIWQGALHGRTSTQLWVWERSNVPHATTNGSILHRPDCVEAVGRAGLDLNRLSEEATALQNCEKQVAILYSQPSRIYTKEYIADLFRTYEGVLFSGNRPHFITEKQIHRLSEFKVLLVPGVTHTEPQVLEEVKTFQNNGGIVILIDSDKTVLKRNKYNQVTESQIVEEIYHNAVWTEGGSIGVSPDAEASERISQLVNQHTNHEFTVKSSEGSYYIEYTETVCNGRKILNIMNHNSKENRKVQVFRHGVIQEKMTDIISGTVIGPEIELYPYKPVLLEFSE